MAQESPPELEVEGWLQTLGVEGLCPWDVLVFLYRHRASLASTKHIAFLLGYPTGAVVEALQSLESLALVERSRANQGVRLYQFVAPQDPRRGDAFDRLLALADDRAGRLLLSRRLRRGDPPNPNSGLSHSQGDGRGTWLKAI